LCCDSNRPTSCDYGPSPALSDALADLEPEMAEVMSLQFEGGMTSPVNMSHAVAALVESWASGASWDQVRGDTNLEEGDIARVFRRRRSCWRRCRARGSCRGGHGKRRSRRRSSCCDQPITDLS
jgi:superfamily II RNA helicase